MKFIIEREQILKPLKQVSNSLRSRPTLPILNNLLLQVKKNCLLLISTDLEIEIIAQITLNSIDETGITTLPARKFFDICRNLPKDAKISIKLENNRIKINCGRSRYLLSTLPVSEFPNLDDWERKLEFIIVQSNLKKLIESTQFSMANQDVRYYLNGMLLEIDGNQMRTVTTDGHRLSIGRILIEKTLPYHRIIIPRKCIIELLHLLDNSENYIKLQVGDNNICVNAGNYIFTSKLIEGYFPNYESVLPKNPHNILEINSDMFKEALFRTAVLCNEKFHSIYLYLSFNQIKISANNSEQEEAEEILDVIYQGNEIEIGFNVNYLLDVLNALKCQKVRLLLTDGDSSIQIEDSTNRSYIYVIMPIRL